MLTDSELHELADAALADTCGDFHVTNGEVARAVERILAAHIKRALHAAADDPVLRLRGHSGISIRRLRDFDA